MSDINEIKKSIGYAKTDFRAQLTFGGEIILSKADLLSLITTIESQKEEIEEFKEFQSEVADEYSWMNRLLNSYLKSENKLIAEIESLKAITELAVKGLKEIADGGSTGEDARDMRRTADYTISEIERLSQ